VIDAIVIGSGHAGVAAVAELARLGRTTVLVDVGRVLDDDRVRLVDQLSRLDPPDWDEATVELVSRNPTLGDPLPRRLDFGSEHVYEPDDAPPLPTVRRFPFAPVASLARGGRSNVWGAAVLPTHDRDMNGWPIGRADLEPHYRAVLRSMPLSGARDGLEAEFPIYRDSIDQLTIPPAAQLVAACRSHDRVRALPTGRDGRPWFVEVVPLLRHVPQRLRLRVDRYRHPPSGTTRGGWSGRLPLRPDRADDRGVRRAGRGPVRLRRWSDRTDRR
jgi:choline dehydrogenase-like flavoprotein